VCLWGCKSGRLGAACRCSAVQYAVRAALGLCGHCKGWCVGAGLCSLFAVVAGAVEACVAWRDMGNEWGSKAATPSIAGSCSLQPVCHSQVFANERG
jgi:hypothetical protein